MSKAQLMQEIAAEIGLLCGEKNESYGDSFVTSGKILALLYPQGIQPDQMRDALGVVRVLDKLSRIANRKDAFGESPWRDVAGYGIVGAAADESDPIPFFPSPPIVPRESRATDPEKSRKTYVIDTADPLVPTAMPVPCLYKIAAIGEGVENSNTVREDIVTASEVFFNYRNNMRASGELPLSFKPHTVYVQNPEGVTILEWRKGSVS